MVPLVYFGKQIAVSLRMDEKGDCNDDKTERVEITTKNICNIFHCDICNKEFKNESNLQNHDKNTIW